MDDFQIERLTENFVDEVFMLESKLLGKTSRQKISDSIASSTLNYFILKINNSVVGFYEVSVIPPEAEIYDIAVKEEFQGKGFGKLLLKHLIDFCKSKNVNTIFLEVNNINNKAINLYKNFGFNVYSKRKNYYGENDAILMNLHI